MGTNGKDYLISLNNLISIIIPVLNCERTIRACLKGIFDQAYSREHYEIIIIDNGSTDKSVEIIKQYPVKLLFEKRAHNSYMARNIGIKHAAVDTTNGFVLATELTPASVSDSIYLPYCVAASSHTEDQIEKVYADKGYYGAAIWRRHA